MKVKVKMMLRYGRALLRPGEIHDLPKSQALVMITNGFVEASKKSDSVSCPYCEKLIPKDDIEQHQENCPERPEDEEEVAPYEEWSKKELKDELGAREIDFEKNANKDILVQLLESDDEESEESGEDDSLTDGSDEE